MKKENILYGEKCDNCKCEWFHEDDRCPDCGDDMHIIDIQRTLCKECKNNPSMKNSDTCQPCILTKT